MADSHELLRRHRPQLRYDSQDPYCACSALTIVENPGNRLVDGSGKQIAIADGSVRALGLRHLHTGASHEGERLDEVGNEDAILRDAVHLQAARALRTASTGGCASRADRLTSSTGSGSTTTPRTWPDAVATCWPAPSTLHASAAAWRASSWSPHLRDGLCSGQVLAQLGRRVVR